jgi:hypothetical protein
MGDRATETLQQFHDRRDEQYARDLLLNNYLDLDDPWISNHIDCFVRQSRGNNRVEYVVFCPYAVHGKDEVVREKLGQAIGNLQALDKLTISNNKDHDDDDVVPVPDWERLARILSHMWQKVALNLDDSDLWTVREAQGLARAIREHPTITSFDGCYNFPYESMDSLYSVLATLPALESIRLSSPPEDESALANPESMTDLLRAPSLRSVYFGDFLFTSALCQATTNALMEGTTITNLEFWNCSFPAGECASMMAKGLSQNISVISMIVVSKVGGALFDALAVALPLNTTLRELSFGVDPSDDDPSAHIDWSPIFLALGRNTGLKSLKVDVHCSMEESLCTAMQNGLGTNTTLEHLELKPARLRSDLWCRTFSFLRTNKALKSLVVYVHQGIKARLLSAFRKDIVSMLQENASLESLSIQKNGLKLIKAEVHVELVTMLQHNTTLKRLELSCNGRLPLTDNDDKRIAKILQKNYALESLPNIVSLGDVDAILRLNAAGRRYLIEEGSSISKGVGVLSRVNNEINCVVLHLLENPRLCDRSAVEVASHDTEESRQSTNPVNDTGKREQGHAL